MDEQAISDALQAAADRRTAIVRGRDIRPLKGIRGVPNAELAKCIDAAWQAGVDLDRDAAALSRLFGAAWEDGLLAIGLVAGALPDAPDAAWDIVDGWLDIVDDSMTADALGWLVLGPSLLATGRPVDDLPASREARPMARRAGVLAGMAMLPEPVEGPAAAALRARMGERAVGFVSEPLSDGLAALATAYVRDEDPGVRKGLRRVLRAWTGHDPAAVAAWGEGIRGGLHTLLGDEVRRARRKADRAAREQQADDTGEE